MPHGHADWANILQVAMTYTLQDMAELAARLGSVVTRDRRGNVILMHDFSHGLSPAIAGYGGTDADHYLVADPAETGGYAYKLIAGSGVNNFVYMACESAGTPLGRSGIEWHFAYALPYTTLRFVLSTYTPEGYYDFTMRFRYTEDDVQIQDAYGDWITVTGAVPPPQGNNIFHSVKIVCDSEDGEYIRLVINGQEYDLTGNYAMFVEGGTGYTVYFYLYLVTSPGENPYVVVDYFIFTVNE